MAKGQLSANFSADPTSGCAPIRIVFKDESSGSPDAWRWDLGGGVISTQQNPSRVYLDPGIYTIKLTVFKGTDSATVIKTGYISIYGVPSVDFSAVPRNGCLPLPVTFTDLSKPGSGTLAKWQWDFGDGILGDGSKLVHTYRLPGTFQVTLTVTNSFGCVASATKTNYITVNDSIRAGIRSIVPASCTVPITARFFDSSVGSPVTNWWWDFGDGGTSTLKNPTYTYTKAGSYSVRLVVQNIYGCRDTITVPSLINAGNFNADFSVQSPACANNKLQFTNSSLPASLLDSSKWTFGDGTSSSALNPVKAFSNPGTYQVKLVSYFGLCKDSTTRSVTILPSPQADFSGTNLSSCLAPLTSSFTNLTSGGTVVRWNFGNGQSSTQSDPSTTYTSLGSYTVSLVVQGTNGCLDTLVRTNYVNIALPKIRDVVGMPYQGCIPYQANFDVVVNTTEPVASYLWDFGDGTTSTLKNPSKLYDVSGIYEASLKIVTVSGCIDTIKKEIKVGTRPKAGFSADPLLVCPEDIVDFTNESTGAPNEFLWFFGDGGTSKDYNPTHQYNDTGWMRVTLIAFNNGCGDTLERNKYIYVNPPIARFTDSFSCTNPYERFFFDNSIGPMTWRWRFGDFDSVDVQNTTYIFKDTGVFSIQLQVWDTVCTHKTSKLIRIIDERADFVTKDFVTCKISTLEFEAKGPRTHPANIVKYEWNFDDGNGWLTTVNPVVTRSFNVARTYQVQLIITDIYNCSDTVTKAVDIGLYGPKANFGPSFQAACAGSLIPFADSSKPTAGIPITKWIWNFGFGNDTTFTSEPFERVYPNPGVFDVQLTVEDQLGCRDTLLRKSAVAMYKPHAQFMTPDTVVCVGAPVRFVNQSLGSKLKYSWNLDESVTDTARNPIRRFNAEGRYSIGLSVADTIGCRDSIYKPLYILVANAKASFEVSDSFTSCPPLVVRFTNNSISAQVNQWDFGNGNTSMLANPVHTYTYPGVFRAKLKVTGNGGCSDTASRLIRLQGPSGNITYGPLAGCPPIIVNFKSTAINTKFYTWDFSDGQSDVTTDSVTSHVYNLPGDYVPRLILEDGLGCKLPVPGPDTIRLLGAKAFIRSIPQYSFCDTATIQFFDSTVTNDVVVSRLWTFGDGTSSTLANPIKKYNTPGKYTVIFEVRTQSGCVTRDTLPAQILINPTPRIDIGADSAACVPATIQFRATWLNADTSVVRWQWSFGDGRASSQFYPPPVDYNRPGPYAVRLNASTVFGCADSSVKLMRINDTPRVNASPYTFLCLGQSVQLQAAGAKTYQWSPNSSLSCTNCANPLATPLSNEIFNVTGTDSNNCKSSDTVLIRVKPPGALEVGPGDTICVGQSVKLTSFGTELFRWEPATGLSSNTQPNVTARPLVTTTYSVIGFDSLRCFYDTAYIKIIVYPIPQFDIIDAKISAVVGSVLKVRTKSSADVTKWLWTPATRLSCIDCPEPMVTIGPNISYTATVSNDGNCLAEDKVTIEPICQGQNVFIPNTFSPNGDGSNDVFYPRGKGIARIKSMRIFNRWGELMYERKDFGANDPSAGWDGTYKGVLLTPDVYVYLIDVMCDNNVIFNLKGNVTLLR